MIAGCLDWQKSGLIRPAIVQATTEAYFSDQDLLGQWIEDCCEIRVGSDLWDRSADLFDSWSEYASKAGEDPGSKKAFGQAMQRRGFEPHRYLGVRAFKFIRLKVTPGIDLNGAKRQQEP
jgi:putative DNA primase/helicase